MKTVFVGMSGGVDSSVSAALLKDQGYKVVGVYMKNWTKDFKGTPCTWQEDFQDAKRVAVQLGINFEVFDFQKQYKQTVVDYMINEYKAGHTPNPDVMCNQEVKFKLFLNTAIKNGAEMIATGHYAQTSHGQLLTASNPDKDQTYFLYRVNSSALKKTIFPVGGYKTKAEIRDIAKKYKLVTADKKDSQGICFVGQVGIKEFLSEYVKTKTGDIVNSKGEVVGKHQGAIYYTIGQRHGLSVGGGLPYYVTRKDMSKNIVYVTNDLQDPNLWHKKIKLTNTHWVNKPPVKNKTYQVRTRHRAKLVDCTVKDNLITLKNPIRALTLGQSAVIYDDQLVLGGGIVSRATG